MPGRRQNTREEKPKLTNQHRLTDKYLQAESKDIAFIQLKGPLFPPKGISHTDIKQGALGECFFDATMLSIIQQSPSWFQEALHQNKDGSISVRVYLPAREDKADKLEPHYITVDYTDFIPADKKKSKFHHHANYIVILEKAYAAACKLMDKAPEKPLTEYLSGGLPADVMRCFFGRPAEEINLSADQSENTFIKNAFKSLLMNEFKSDPEQLPQNLLNLKNYVAQLMRANNIKEKEDVYLEYQSSLKRNTNPFIDASEAKSISKLDNDALFDLIMHSSKLIASVGQFQPLNKPIEINPLLPKLQYLATKLYDNRAILDNSFFETRKEYKLEAKSSYSQTQLDIFKSVEQSLKQKRQLTFATDPNLSGKQSTGHADEPISHGLVAKHAYGIVSAFTAEDGKKYIRIRNPWGETGSTYLTKHFKSAIQRCEFEAKPDGIVHAINPNDAENIFESPGAMDPSKGDFVIELADFIHNGRTITSSSLPNQYNLLIEGLNKSYRYYSNMLPEGSFKAKVIELRQLLLTRPPQLRDFLEGLACFKGCEDQTDPLNDSLVRLSNCLFDLYAKDHKGFSTTTMMTMQAVIDVEGKSINDLNLQPPCAPSIFNLHTLAVTSGLVMHAVGVGLILGGITAPAGVVLAILGAAISFVAELLSDFSKPSSPTSSNNHKLFQDYDSLPQEEEFDLLKPAMGG